MSRTIRRTKSKKSKSNFEDDFTHRRFETHDEDVRAWGGLPLVKLEGHEFDKKYHRYHGDTRKNYGWVAGKVFMKIGKVKTRARNRQEIIRFMKNPDYEVVNYEEPDISWYC